MVNAPTCRRPRCENAPAHGVYCSITCKRLDRFDAGQRTALLCIVNELRQMPQEWRTPEQIAGWLMGPNSPMPHVVDDIAAAAAAVE